MKKTFICNYPLDHQHEGTMLGNSYVGLYAWGEDNELRISVGCGALWDHRGGMSWSARQNYKDICRALAENDANMMESIFATDAEQEGKTAARPCIIPVGRLIFTLKEGCRLLRNELDRSTGGMTIFYSYCGEEKFAELRLKMRKRANRKVSLP